MARTRQSARTAGTTFERHIANYLAAAMDDNRIDRRVKTGNKDRGDITGLRCHAGKRIVVECKNTARLALPEWTNQAHIEAHNDDALVGIVVHKRHGTTNPARQWVTMTLADLVALLTGQPQESE